MLLAGYYNKQTLAIVAAGLMVGFAGGSRATIGLFAIGLVITLVLSMWRQGTGRKAAVAAALLATVVVTVPVLYTTAIERRSSKTLEDSNLERVLMRKTARMIIADYPLGIGPNRYVVVANTGGYSARAGMRLTP